tara:strand:- start:2732 stop:2938 length:207 start_codon:yes stop_codon:yes gene_type:complete
MFATPDKKPPTILRAMKQPIRNAIPRPTIIERSKKDPSKSSPSKNDGKSKNIAKSHNKIAIITAKNSI